MNPGRALCPAYRMGGWEGRGQKRASQRGRRRTGQGRARVSRALGNGGHGTAGCHCFLSFCAHFVTWVQDLRGFPLPSAHSQSCRQGGLVP